MKVTQMPPVHAATLVANSGNTAYGVDVIKVANPSKIDKFEWFIAHRLQMAPSGCTFNTLCFVKF